MSERSYAGPPDYRAVSRHGVFPDVSHDEAARFNFLAHLNRHLATEVLPGVKRAYDSRVLPKLTAELGRAPAHRREVRAAMRDEPIYQLWSALRRATMEQRQQAGRALVLRQLGELNARAAALNANADTLKLDLELKLPRYVEGVDHHLMPGSYHTEVVADDVSAAANYDAGIFATTGGGLGRLNDGAGAALVSWLSQHAADFKPARILDLGAGLGHNTLPIAALFPEAQVIAVDVAAPMLRYGHARAKSLGVNNVQFVQANVESLDFPDGHFDFIYSTMFLHETSFSALPRVLAEVKRLLAPGGRSLHLEQPQYTEDMDVYEQFIRDWDAFNNNEPFWTTMHELDLPKIAQAVGHQAAEIVESGAAAVLDPQLFPAAALAPTAPLAAEDYGRKAAWYAFGTRAA